MGKASDNGKQATATTPRFRIPWVRIPQPDGSILIRPGKPIVEPEEIGTPEFAQLTGLSIRRVQYLCEVGEIEARRMSNVPGSRYLIPLTELERYLQIRS